MKSKERHSRVVVLALVSFIPAFVLFNCRGERKPAGFEGKLISSIVRNCQSASPCVVQMRNATEFTWDRMFVFKYTAHRDEAERALGTKLERFTEFHRKIVFLNNGKVVFYEEELTNIEHPVSNEVVFDIPDDKDYRVYNSDAAFEVRRVSSEHGLYYQLTLVQAKAK